VVLALRERGRGRAFLAARGPVPTLDAPPVLPARPAAPLMWPAPTEEPAPPVAAAPPERPGPEPVPGPERVPGPEPPLARRAAPPVPGAFLPGAAAAILAVLALGFVVNLLVLGQLRHSRDQQEAYASYRGQLANGTAPVGPADLSGKLWKLGTPVALLEIPQLRLREVVGEGTTSGSLVAGPGHRRDTVLPGQPGTSVILGRRAAYGAPFADLARLRAGEEFTVTTGQGGNVFRVLGVRRAGDLQPPALQPGTGRLTLVTSDGPAWLPSGSLRVDADLVSKVRRAPARVITAATLPDSERLMATEPVALVPLVLWGQVLLAVAGAVVWARSRWGRAQTWLVGTPVVLVVGIAVADQVTRLLPNLL